MKKLLCLLVLAAATLGAQMRTVTCPDGSVVGLTPFNQADPCRNATPTPEAELPDGFLLIYGPPPVFEGDSLAWRVARVNYQSALKNYRGLQDLPEDYANVASIYANYGLGAPLAFATPYATYFRWIDAPYTVPQAVQSTALKAPNVVVAQWHTDAIRKGFCVFDAHPWVPGKYLIMNRANCDPEEELGSLLDYTFDDLLVDWKDAIYIGDDLSIIDVAFE